MNRRDRPGRAPGIRARVQPALRSAGAPAHGPGSLAAGFRSGAVDGRPPGGRAAGRPRCREQSPSGRARGTGRCLAYHARRSGPAPAAARVRPAGARRRSRAASRRGGDRRGGRRRAPRRDSDGGRQPRVGTHHRRQRLSRRRWPRSGHGSRAAARRDPAPVALARGWRSVGARRRRCARAGPCRGGRPN